jgi:hypothetical protein
MGIAERYSPLARTERASSIFEQGIEVAVVKRLKCPPGQVHVLL